MKSSKHEESLLQSDGLRGLAAVVSRAVKHGSLRRMGSLRIARLTALLEELDGDGVTKCEEIISKKESNKNAVEKAKQRTEEDKAADQSFLDSLIQQCEQTAKDWDARSKTRANELQAITEALEIIKGKVAATYGANKQLNLLSTGARPHGHWVWVSDPASFLQVASPVRDKNLPQRKFVRFLKSRAKALKSTALSTLLLKVEADHFKKVRTMIKDMVAKLKADAEEEQTQKGWCDEEMKKATEKRDENIGSIEDDTAMITGTKASLEELSMDIKDLEEQIAALFKSLNDATKMREGEKAENTKTVEDSKAGLGATTAAIKVLKDFYEKSMLQVSASGRRHREPAADSEGKSVADLAPQTGLEGEYKGNQAASVGIIGLMEVIRSDFERTIEETENSEAAAADEYANFKKDTMDMVKEKKDLTKTKKEDVNTAKANLMEFDDNLKQHTDLKGEALAELAKLTPACVGTGMDYAERVARREQEIQSLKNAYVILDGMS